MLQVQLVAYMIIRLVTTTQRLLIQRSLFELLRVPCQRSGKCGQYGKPIRGHVRSLELVASTQHHACGLNYSASRLVPHLPLGGRGLLDMRGAAVCGCALAPATEPAGR